MPQGFPPHRLGPSASRAFLLPPAHPTSLGPYKHLMALGPSPPHPWGYSFWLTSLLPLVTPHAALFPWAPPPHSQLGAAPGASLQVGRMVSGSPLEVRRPEGTPPGFNSRFLPIGFPSVPYSCRSVPWVRGVTPAPKKNF